MMHDESFISWTWYEGMGSPRRPQGLWSITICTPRFGGLEPPLDFGPLGVQCSAQNAEVEDYFWRTRIQPHSSHMELSADIRISLDKHW